MPDRWGRFSMDDGLAIANTVNTIRGNYEAQKEKEKNKLIEDQTYQVYEALSSGKQVPEGVDPVAKYSGELKHIDMQFQKRRSSKEGMLEEAATAEQTARKIKDLSTNYLALRRSGQDEKAIQIGKDIINLSPNGVWADIDENGGAKITKYNHSVEEMPDIPVDRLDQYVAGMMNIDNDELAKKTLTGKQFRIQQNQKNLEDAINDQWVNDKGDVIFRVKPSWGSDGKPVPAFFIRSPNDPAPIPKKDVAGYKPVKAAENVQKLQKGGLDITGAKLQNQKTRADVANANIIDPRKVATSASGETQGLIKRDQQGGLSMTPIEGGVQQPKGPSNVKDRQYDVKVATQNFMGKYGLSQDPEGGINSPDMTKEEAQAAMQDARSIGLNVYFEKGTREDTGSGLNPFDNKQVETYRVRAIAPAQEGGLQMDQGQTQQQGGGWRQWANKQPQQTKPAQQVQRAPQQQPAPQQKPSRQEYNPQIPETWNVVMSGTDLIIVTPQGPIKMSPEQIEAWKQTSEGQRLFSSPALNTVDTGQAASRKERMQKSFLRTPPRG